MRKVLSDNILYFFCLGANHEHNREDRDEYISIDESKVSPEKLKTDYTKADGSFNGRGTKQCTLVFQGHPK